MTPYQKLHIDDVLFIDLVGREEEFQHRNKSYGVIQLVFLPAKRTAHTHLVIIVHLDAAGSP